MDNTIIEDRIIITLTGLSPICEEDRKTLPLKDRFNLEHFIFPYTVKKFKYRSANISVLVPTIKSMEYWDLNWFTYETKIKSIQP